MKKLLGFFLLAVAIVFAVLGIQTANQQAHEAQRGYSERLIAQHHVVPGMTMPEVERSLGAPSSKTLGQTGTTVWHYAEHQIVFDAEGLVIHVPDSLLPSKIPSSSLKTGVR